MLGYKVMRRMGNQLVSGANSRLVYPAKIGAVVSAPRNGVYLSTNRRYVLEYYSGHHDNEALVTLEFDPETMLFGNLTDVETEIAVPTARIVAIEDLEAVGASERPDEIREIHERLCQRILSEIPYPPSSTVLFQGIDSGMVYLATDPELAMADAIKLLVPLKANYVTIDSISWLCWALVQNPAFPLLCLERADLLARVVEAYLRSMEETIRRKAHGYPSMDSNEKYNFLAAGMNLFADIRDSFEDSYVKSECDDCIDLLHPSKNSRISEARLKAQRQNYRTRTEYMEKMGFPDLLPLLYPSL